jgi:tRNA (uracil-5-)-methyltransferase TRM9
MKLCTAEINVFRSRNLVSIAKQHQPHSVLVADILRLPHAPRAFDFAISIAVVHHLSTTERRVDAVRSLLNVLKPGGQALVYVWALEQESSRRGWSEQDDQDVMVPWVTRGSKKSASGAEMQSVANDKTYHRYYHLYRKHELEDNIIAAGGRIVEAGYEKDNWWAIATLNDQ